MDLKYLKLANAAVSLKSKVVLEVGGCVPTEDIESYSPAAWTSVDINEKRVNAINLDKMIPFERKAFLMSACEMNFKDNVFDRVFSINCFEHIIGLESALSEMYRVLKPDGLLFTIFGPIWSAPMGHHTYIETETKVIHFNDNIFPDWQHILKSKEEFSDSLNESFSNDIIEQITDYIYRSNDVNRLADGDYYNLIKNSGFTPILILKNRKGRQLTRAEISEIKSKNSKIVDPRTTEILLVLKKGKYSPLMAAKSLINLGLCKLSFKFS